MATTCKLIAKSVLGSNAADITFSSIPATGYDDLLVVVSARATTAGYTYDSLYLSFNGSTSNFSGRYLQGTGSSAASGTLTGIPRYIGNTTAANATSNTYSSVELYVPNYAGSANKSYSSTSAHETNATAAFMTAVAGLWSNTSAISSLSLSAAGGNLVSGSSAYLYGITKA